MKKIIQSFLLRSWWLYLILLGGFLLYAHGMHKKDLICREMEKKQYALEQERIKALEQKDELLMQIGSQNDPEWIQMTLMKGLGLVPEGQKKVYFKNKDE